MRTLLRFACLLLVFWGMDVAGIVRQNPTIPQLAVYILIVSFVWSLGYVEGRLKTWKY